PPPHQPPLPPRRSSDLDGRLTTQKVIVTRPPRLDFAALSAAFAGRPLGLLSPADSVRTTIAGAAIAVAYSRPAMRGRQIFGGLRSEEHTSELQSRVDLV